ncbi:MAG: YdeI/OmpD-associated family protein [Actinomycetota bacterium]|nr:YdeI/OmpD-associated family protein [Actinomycetota bacterium]
MPPDRHGESAGQREPVMFFKSAAAWEEWLAENHARAASMRVKMAKRGSGIASVAYPEVLAIAISYGWIDGVRNAFDENHFLQRFTPRRARSRWSKINRETATRLIESKRMKPAGLREVEKAKADGRWEAAYDSHRTASVPDDLRRALCKNRGAGEFFATLDSQNRYAVLYRIADAKRPETRARRISQFVEMLSRGEKLHP